FVAVFLLLITLGEAVPLLGINSKLALICVYLGGALGANTFLMYGFFNTIPIEFDEPARIDGASHAQIYWRLVMPMMVPIQAVVGLLAVVEAFDVISLARIVLSGQFNFVLEVGIYQ